MSHRPLLNHELFSSDERLQYLFKTACEMTPEKGDTAGFAYRNALLAAATYLKTGRTIDGRVFHGTNEDALAKVSTVSDIEALAQKLCPGKEVSVEYDHDTGATTVIVDGKRGVLGYAEVSGIRTLEHLAWAVDLAISRAEESK